MHPSIADLFDLKQRVALVTGGAMGMNGIPKVVSTGTLAVALLLALGLGCRRKRTLPH